MFRDIGHYYRVFPYNIHHCFSQKSKIKLLFQFNNQNTKVASMNVFLESFIVVADLKQVFLYEIFKLSNS